MLTANLRKMRDPIGKKRLAGDLYNMGDGIGAAFVQEGQTWKGNLFEHSLADGRRNQLTIVGHDPAKEKDDGLRFLFTTAASKEIRCGLVRRVGWIALLWADVVFVNVHWLPWAEGARADGVDPPLEVLAGLLRFFWRGPISSTISTRS